MKLVVFGGTKGTGRELVQQALLAGHDVTQFGRSQPEDDAGRVRGFSADVMDEQAVTQAVRGQDAVVCALGAGAFSKARIRERGTRVIIQAMQRVKVQRLACLSVLGLGESVGNLTPFLKHLVIPLYLRRAFKDHERQESEVTLSGLDWTIVRPPTLTDGPKTGEYHHGFSPNQTGLALKVSRADVADFMLKVLSEEGYKKRSVGISY